jgi:hypothetical protein
MYLLGLHCQRLPQRHHVAVEADGAAGVTRRRAQLADAGDDLAHVADHLVHPALRVALAEGRLVDLGNDTDGTHDVAGLGLRAAHACTAEGCRRACSMRRDGPRVRTPRARTAQQHLAHAPHSNI